MHLQSVKIQTFYIKNIKYWFIFTYFLWHQAFQIYGGSLLQSVLTGNHIQDKRLHHRPSLPLKPFSFSSSFHFYTFLQFPFEPFVADSLCTICCVHMRFADGSLSTAEQHGDWSSQSGNRERSPVSEKCKFLAIQHPETQRDQDGNVSCYTAPTERDQGG